MRTKITFSPYSVKCQGQSTALSFTNKIDIVSKCPARRTLESVASRDAETGHRKQVATACSCVSLWPNDTNIRSMCVNVSNVALNVAPVQCDCKGFSMHSYPYFLYCTGMYNKRKYHPIPSTERGLHSCLLVHCVLSIHLNMLHPWIGERLASVDLVAIPSQLQPSG